MSIFVMADLHLSTTTNKPMDVFGSRWNSHMEKIKKNWCAIVNEDDTVKLFYTSNGKKFSQKANDCTIPNYNDTVNTTPPASNGENAVG